MYGSLVAVILLEHSCFAIRCGECSFDLLLQYAARSAAARLAIIGESLDRIVAMSYRARCLLTGPLVVTHNAFQKKALASSTWAQAVFHFCRGGVAVLFLSLGTGRLRLEREAAAVFFHRDCACAFYWQHLLVFEAVFRPVAVIEEESH